nr:reverse transcriptase domain-containing protein [Tanacetum cinerariifolium]
NSVNSPEPTLSSRPTIVDVPKELPKVSLVNTSLKKLKHHLAALKDDLRKLKGKALADDTITSHSIATVMLNVDVEPLALKFLNNRTAHSDYLRHAQEQYAILREVVEQGKSQNPLNNSLDHAFTPNCETCGGPHSYNDCLDTIGQTQNVYALRAYQGGNTITNLKEDMKGITARSGTAYQGPTIPTTSSSSLPKVVERETEVTKDTVHPTNDGSTKDVQSPVVQIETPVLNSEPIVSPIIEPIVAPVSDPKPNQKPSIPYPSRLHDQKLRNKANE